MGVAELFGFVGARNLEIPTNGLLGICNFEITNAKNVEIRNPNEF